MRVGGYAAKFDSVYALGWFDEVVRKGAFDGAEMSDVVALLNHDDNIVLGRTSAGTVLLEVDEVGLKYTIDLPDSPNGRNAYEAIRRGDIKESSWAFTVESQTWTERGRNEPDLREIVKIKRVYDVSPVTYPANPDTSVAERSKPKTENKNFKQFVAVTFSLAEAAQTFYKQ
jgi:HK97 family phage prohead protease